MAEGSYEFRPKPSVLSAVELDELLRVAPPADALAKVPAATAGCSESTGVRGASGS